MVAGRTGPVSDLPFVMPSIAHNLAEAYGVIASTTAVVPLALLSCMALLKWGAWPMAGMLWLIARSYV